MPAIALPTFLRGMVLIGLLLAGTAQAGDPFDDARYAIGIKDNATALRIVDAGQFDIDMQNAEGYTLLSFAAGDGNLAMVEALLERGAKPNLRNMSGMTALDRAVGTMVSARIRAAGGVSGLAPVAAPATKATPKAAPKAAAKAPAKAPAKAAAPAAKAAATAKPNTSPAAQSPHAKMCASRHYSSSALCSDSTCKMREYRKWQTCLKTGSYY